MFSKLVGQFFGGGDQNSAAGSGALEPIAGITLEKYAELCAKMANTPNDDEAFVAVAEANGVSREDWVTARARWNARMEDVSTAATVALAYMPLYQAALAQYGGPVATATYEEYIEMSAMINSDLPGDTSERKSLDRMYAKFGINPQKWSQISTHWVDKLTKDPVLGSDYAKKTRASVKEMDAEWSAN